MGKFVFFAAFLAAALVAGGAAQGVTSESEQRLRDAQCRREVLENPLHSCRQVVDRLLTGRVGVVGAVPFQLDARAQCCLQLQGVSRECRCSAVRQMVRSYEQTFPPLEGGYGGEWPEQQEQGYYYGEGSTERQQQGSEAGYYGETARSQQGQEHYGERPQQQQQQGEGYYGEAAGRQQQGEEYYGDERQQREGSYSGEAAGRQQQGEEYYGGERRAAPPRVTRVKLTKVRQYVARLPNMCQMEPLECSVFSDDQY